LLATFYACIEEFIPPSVKIKSNRYITVNGIIYNDDSLKTIILSRSIDAWEPDSLYKMVKNAQVEIIDDLDNKVTFYQSEDGIYQSLFHPQHKRSYQLHIIDEFGDEYLSEQVKMEITPEIDSIYWKMNTNPDSEGEQNQGIDIMIATHEDVHKYSYYRWELTEAWEIRTLYRSVYKYIDGNIIPTNEIPYSCWIENSPADIIIGNTESFSRNQITNKVIQVIPFVQNKLHIRYSIQVRQYALDKKAYKFWDNLQNSNETSGSLFDPQPTEIKSNIMKINDSEEPVMGYFDIYEVKKKRIFIDRDEIPIVKGISSGYLHCETVTIEEKQVAEFMRRGYHIYGFIRSGPETLYVVTIRDCSDCRTRGSENKPTFWE